MKKITFLVAAVLASAGMSAQTVQKWAAMNDPDSEGLLFPWNTTFQAWIGADENPDEPDAQSFVSGNIALFNDEVYNVLTNPDLGMNTDSPAITVGTGVELGGIQVDNSKVTYTFSPESESVAFNAAATATDAALTKSGDGTLYTDVVNNLPGGTVIKGGTVARKSKSSIATTVFGKKVTIEGEGTVDLGSMGSDYAAFGADVNITDGSTWNLYPSRYTYMTSDTNIYVTGNGTINVYSRGERVFLSGAKNAHPADFSGFTGKLNIFKADDTASGLNGIIFPAESAKGTSASRAFYAKLDGDSLLYNVWKNDKLLLDSLFYNWTGIELLIGEGASVMCESAGGTPNVAMVAVKSLNVDKKGIVAGYYKDSNPQLVLLFGRDGKDSYIDGTITAATKGNKPYREDGVGLIKEGTGTTYITAPDNQIFLGMEVWEGRVLFNNPDPQNTTATGQNKVSSNNVVTCRPTGTIGGFGTIGGHTALYGTMQPGSDAVDTLRINAANAIVVYDTDNKGIYSEATGMKIAARESGSAANLLLYNGANIEFEIIDKDKHDVVAVENEIRVYSDTEAGTDAKINIKLAPRDKWSVAEGDEIVLMQADTIRSYVDGVTDENCFNLIVDDAFNGATFELKSVKVPAETETEYDPIKGENVTTVIAPAQYKLVAKCTKAGNGEAEPDAIENVDADNSNLQVYPNPARGGNVTIAVAAGEVANVAVYNSAAQLVKSVATAESTLTLDVSDLQAGIYYVRVTTAEKAYTQKLIVE